MGRFKFARWVCEDMEQVRGNIKSGAPPKDSKEREEVFLCICCYPLLTAIHGNPVLGSVDDPGKSCMVGGKSWMNMRSDLTTIHTFTV